MCQGFILIIINVFHGANYPQHLTCDCTWTSHTPDITYLNQFFSQTLSHLFVCPQNLLNNILFHFTIFTFRFTRLVEPPGHLRSPTKPPPYQFTVNVDLLTLFWNRACDSSPYKPVFMFLLQIRLAAGNTHTQFTALKFPVRL